MGKTASTYETKASYETRGQAREGKSYAYQKPQESAAATGTVRDHKQKVVDAFDDFMDAIADRVGTTPPPTPPDTTPGAGTGVTTPGSTAPPASGAPSDTPPVSGTPATGSATTPTPATGGEQPEAAKEAFEVSLASQKSAYARDKSRESTRHATRETGAPSTAAATAPAAGLSKHTSDSNRAPITENAEWTSSFGALGKGAAPTIEKMIVPARRPETVPAAGTVASPKPIDAYWGSFGTALERAVARARMGYQQLEAIIGNDDRVRVTNNEVYPWRCICSLIITANTGASYIGTGWLVSPRLVLTAGHCVYMADEGGWATNIEVIPGRDAHKRPYGSAISRDLRSVSGWTRDNDSDYDYGAILLPADKRFGEQLGWFGYAARADDYLRGVTLNLAGYPGDGGKAPNQVEGSMWYHSRGVRDVMNRQITYEIDTFGGQSGAPVWEMASNGSRYGVGIHTWGTPVNNGATRITGDVFDNIVLWASQAP